MNGKPLVSVVIPVYNVAKYLPLTLDSVLNQDYRNFEIILVDDGSTDESPTMCDKYAAKHENIKVVHKANSGVGMARNSGLDVAVGDYVYFLDGDDTIPPYCLSSFFEIMSEYDLDVSLIFTRFQLVGEDDRMKEPAKVLDYDFYDDKYLLQERFLLRQLVILAPGTLYNRKWLVNSNIRFRDIPYSEDQLFIWEALLHVRRAIMINCRLYNYLQHPGSIMSSTRQKKILEAYPYFKQLHNRVQTMADVNPLVKRFLLARWCLGIFHSSAKLCTVEEYADLMNVYEAKKHLKLLRNFPDVRVRLMAYLSILGPRIYRYINKVI